MDSPGPVQPWWHKLPAPLREPRPILRVAALLAVLALPLVVQEIFGGRTEPRWLHAPGEPRAPESSPEVVLLLDEVERNPRSPDALIRLAAVYLHQGRLGEAADTFSGALPDVRAVLGLSMISLRMDDAAQALTLARQAADQAPQDPLVLNHLAIVLSRERRFQEADDVFRKAIAAAPKDALILLNAAAGRAQAGAWSEAEAYCRRAAQAAPQALTPRLALGELYMRQERVAEAVTELETLTRAHPESAAAWETLARAYRHQNRLPEAMNAIRDAQRLRPDRAETYLEAGYTLLHMGSRDGAVAQLEEALRRSADPRAARLGIAEAYRREGAAARAVQVYEQALRDDPDDPLMLNNLAFVLAELGQDLDRAGRLARRALEALPRDPTVLDTLGWVCHRAGRDAEALDHLQGAIRLAPEKGLYRYHHGKALQGAGRPREAADAYRAALARDLSAAERSDAEASLTALPR